MYNRISFIITPVLIIVNVSRQPPVTELNLALRALYCACAAARCEYYTCKAVQVLVPLAHPGSNK